MGGGGEGSVDTATQSAGGDGVKVHINARSSNGSKFTCQISLESTVRSFKEVLSPQCDIPADQQRLIYKGRILKDDQTLQSYGLEADHIVHLVRGFVPPASAATAGAANSTQARDVGSNDGGTLGFGRGSGPRSGVTSTHHFGPSTLRGLGLDVNGRVGSGGLFGTELPDFEQVQQQFTQNPNVMRDIMNMPVVQNIMNSPDIMRNLIMTNPEMREIIDRNPELAHVLNDPGILRQTLEAARNPELLREMMRNTDRAMSNIEATPEGFNMLRRMYENVQEPFMNATTMGGNARSDGSNPFAALLGDQVGNQTRTQSTTVGSVSATGSPAPNTNPLPNPWSPTGTGVAQTNTSTSNSIGDARPQTPAGIARTFFPEIEGSLAAMPQEDNNLLNQFVQILLSNPQSPGSDPHPQIQNVLDSSSLLREVMQNPELFRQLASPETLQPLQQLLALQQSLMQVGREQQQSTQEPGQTGGGTGSFDNLGLETLTHMFGGLGTGSQAVPNRPVPPEEIYAAQLSQLQEMGFVDQQENILALMATAGNVHAAVERLLGNLG